MPKAKTVKVLDWRTREGKRTRAMMHLQAKLDLIGSAQLRKSLST